MKIYSRKVYTTFGPHPATISVKDGKIIRLDFDNYDKDAVDFGNMKIIPGIFDTHNHGTMGYSLIMPKGTSQQERCSLIRGYLRGLVAQGTTSVFPTVLDLDGIKAVATVANEHSLHGAEILGIHSEGPWLSRVGEKGIRTPWPAVSMSAAEKMVEAGNGLLKLVALAPEIPGISNLIEYFLKNNIVVAAAHSDNNYAQAEFGYNLGISVATHTGNVMTDMHHRDIGGLGAALTDNRVDCEVICDGLHICNQMLSIFFKLKDVSKFMMISDCTALSGAPVGIYKSDTKDTVLNVTKEGFVLTDTGRLMGSSKPVLFGIRNLVENVGISLETCLEMACLNPAKKIWFC